MNGRWTVIAGWAVAWACMVPAQPATAQPPRPQPKVFSWEAAAATTRPYFAILGAVGRPGTYLAPRHEVTLQELVEQAGGFTPNAAATATIVRQGRAQQSVFFSPVGRDVLQPHDIVVVDAISSTRSPDGAAVVWLGLVGVNDRPVIVPIRPELARLDRITGELLGQSRELARAVKVVLPSHAAPLSGSEAQLPSGTVLAFDRSLLVERNLPTFPEPHPFRQPATTAMPVPFPTEAAETALPTAVETLSERTDLPASQSRSPVNAIPVPFPVIDDEPMLANPASIPAPGSRLQMGSRPAPPQSSAKPSDPIAIDPQIAADERVEILPAPPPPAVPSRETSSEPSAVAPPSNFSLWQMLGISGAVACLIGLAIATRRYTDPARSPVFTRTPATPEPQPEEPQTATPDGPTPAPSCSTEIDDLTELFAGKLEVVSEAVQFPKSIRLQRQREPSAPQFRLDAKQPQLPPPHRIPEPAPLPQAVAIDPASTGVPRPHFAKPSTKLTIAARAAAGELKRGTVLERALSQLEGGRSS